MRNRWRLLQLQLPTGYCLDRFSKTQFQVSHIRHGMGKRRWGLGRIKIHSVPKNQVPARKDQPRDWIGHVGSDFSSKYSPEYRPAHAYAEFIGGWRKNHSEGPEIEVRLAGMVASHQPEWEAFWKLRTEHSEGLVSRKNSWAQTNYGFDTAYYI